MSRGVVLFPYTTHASQVFMARAGSTYQKLTSSRLPEGFLREKGTNTKIQVMKRRAYGLRDKEFLKLKILGLHETKYALVW